MTGQQKQSSVRRHFHTFENNVFLSRQCYAMYIGKTGALYLLTTFHPLNVKVLLTVSIIQGIRLRPSRKHRFHQMPSRRCIHDQTLSNRSTTRVSFRNRLYNRNYRIYRQEILCRKAHPPIAFTKTSNKLTKSDFQSSLAQNLSPSLSSIVTRCSSLIYTTY